jgi:hypothetical protein
MENVNPLIATAALLLAAVMIPVPRGMRAPFFMVMIGAAMLLLLVSALRWVAAPFE